MVEIFRMLQAESADQSMDSWDMVLVCFGRLLWAQVPPTPPSGHQRLLVKVFSIQSSGSILCGKVPGLFKMSVCRIYVHQCMYDMYVCILFFPPAYEIIWDPTRAETCKQLGEICEEFRLVVGWCIYIYIYLCMSIYLFIYLYIYFILFPYSHLYLFISD